MIVVKCDKCSKIIENSEIHFCFNGDKLDLCGDCMRKMNSYKKEFDEYYEKAKKILNDAISQKERELDEKYFSRKEENNERTN